MEYTRTHPELLLDRGSHIISASLKQGRSLTGTVITDMDPDTLMRETSCRRNVPSFPFRDRQYVPGANIRCSLLSFATASLLREKSGFDLTIHHR